MPWSRPGAPPTETFMTSRRDSLSYMLLMPALAYASPALADSQPGNPPTTGPIYRTQPGTTELPPRYPPPAGPDARLRLAYWNEVALSTLARDTTPPFPGQAPAVAEQAGPTRATRSMAIVQVAIFEALNAIGKRYPAYGAPLTAFADSSPDAAIAQAAHDALVALFPRQARWLDQWLAADLERLPPGRTLLNGIDIGRRAAAAVLLLRTGDGSDRSDPIVGQDYVASNAPGEWRPDPITQNKTALGAYWGSVRPFVLQSGSQFRIPPLTPLTSPEYAKAFNEVERLGGNGVGTPTSRSAEQTIIGIFWGYDGTAWLGPRPRQYNQIAVQLALATTSDAFELSRVLALVNVAMADAAIAAWESKYYYR